MVRKISDLPVAPVGSAIQEVEVGGAAYQAAAGASGISAISRTIWQLSLGASPFVDDKGLTVTTTGPVTFDNTTTPFSAKFPSLGTTGQGIHIAQGSPVNGTDIGAMTRFTLEGWFSTSQAAQQFTCLASRDNGSGPSGSWSLLVNTDSAGDGKVSFWGTGFGGAPVLKSPAAYNDGNRHHVAVVQMGAWWGLYLDGILVASTIITVSTAAVLTQDIILGGANFANRELIGHLDNWRLVADAMYAGSKFTVPTPPFSTS